MESSLFIQSPSSFSSLFTSKSKPFPSPKPRFVSIKASIEKPKPKPKPKPKSETTSWVSPDWLTSLTRTISSGQNDDSGIPIASAKLIDSMLTPVLDMMGNTKSPLTCRAPVVISMTAAAAMISKVVRRAAPD